MTVYHVEILLFENFETLDVFGPVEILGGLPDLFKLHFVSLQGGLVKSTQGVPVQTEKYHAVKDQDNHQNTPQKIIKLIPGGAGTRDLACDSEFIAFIKAFAVDATYILSVCTGAALLAKAEILDGKKATSNKRAFEWVTTQSSDVNWIKKSRWVQDGHIFTSSGISAGIDMTLGFIETLFGREEALKISNRFEYTWHEDSEYDPFAELYPFTASHEL
ncbi:DJ-1/PfpI family protein [Fusibacter ferrireducens]|uniref:DJ-1/PfpI family protein n=1 Tax=Fusibacter ferrireducens TaxID=2785058 RepID=A0ABR9ZNA1_9FIRM|nr:DJ-1/PfpI family protein [Fusibacter ferrireducens]MBF4691945.1 DJ-1/PfpI family protein [Fusibacter ferrireducens]